MKKIVTTTIRPASLPPLASFFEIAS